MSLHALIATLLLTSGAPDIQSVEADLAIPEVSDGEPAAGKRVLVTDATSGVPVVLYLPADWEAGKSYPVVIELPGNGDFRNPIGDQCNGLPEGCQLGYGITGGRGAIWIALPFLNANGDGIAITWWGDKPSFDPEPTVKLVRRTVELACRNSLGGDRGRLFLVGFSRGAVACNVIGLHDDEIAGLWRGMICYSHYDGVRDDWPFSRSDRESDLTRLKRLGDTPQFICHESDANPHASLETTREHLELSNEEGRFTFCETGFRNHNDAWVLRPSKARAALRSWFWELAK